MFPINPLGSFYLNELNISNITNITCDDPTQYQWVYNVFHECIHNTKEEIGFILGLISIMCWIVAAIP